MFLEKSKAHGGNNQFSREDTGEHWLQEPGEGLLCMDPAGVRPRCTRADRGTGQQAARGQRHPSGCSAVPPNCCFSGPVAIAMLMSQRCREALQCWSWHLSSRRVEAILGFSWVKSRGAARAAHFPTAAASGSRFPSTSPFAPTVVASPCPAQGGGSQPAAESPGEALPGTKLGT